ncbi:MAG TPA: M50 family metallopeptidase [Fimbriimonas sp.]|nr:M50 family metallopeptidase [Fimbriimonas sp.]
MTAIYVGGILVSIFDRDPSHFGSQGRLPLLLLAFVFVLYALVWMHEIGHFLMGKMAGLRLIHFYVKPCSLSKTGPKWRFSLRLRIPLLGFVSMVPTHDRDLFRQMRFFVSGGVLANLVVCVVALIGCFLQHDGGLLWTFDPFFNAELWFGFSAFLVVANAWPYTVKGQYNDGMYFWKLRAEDASALRFLAILILTREVLSGTPVRDLGPEWVEKLRGPEDGSRNEMAALVFLATYLRTQEATDALRKVDERARTFLDKPELISGPMGEGLILTCAFTAVWNRNDPDEARMLLSKYKTTLPTLQGFRKIIEATIAAREADADSVTRLCDEAESLLRKIGEENTFSVEGDFELVTFIRRNELPVPQEGGELAQAVGTQQISPEV